MPFDATGRMATAIPFAFDDYLELVDTTGRVIREDKRGYIPGVLQSQREAVSRTMVCTCSEKPGNTATTVSHTICILTLTLT
jgi:hypothetical protein